MQIKIVVTSEDIARGERGCPDRCPVALALCRAYRGLPYISVDTKDISIKTVDDEWFFGKLSKQTRKFVSRFDLGLTVEPYEFTQSFKA